MARARKQKYIVTLMLLALLSALYIMCTSITPAALRQSLHNSLHGEFDYELAPGARVVASDASEAYLVDGTGAAILRAPVVRIGVDELFWIVEAPTDEARYESICYGIKSEGRWSLTVVSQEKATEDTVYNELQQRVKMLTIEDFRERL